MGIRGELFSTKVSLQNRTYFFNVKENRMGDLYLNIVESKNKETGGFERQSIVLFAEDLQEFLKGFDGSLKVLERAYQEKKRTQFDKGNTVNKEKEAEGREPKKRYTRKTTGSGHTPERPSSKDSPTTHRDRKKPVIKTVRRDSN